VIGVTLICGFVIKTMNDFRRDALAMGKTALNFVITAAEKIGNTIVDVVQKLGNTIVDVAIMTQNGVRSA
jgi:hypothetical protein